LLGIEGTHLVPYGGADRGRIHDCWSRALILGDDLGELVTELLDAPIARQRDQFVDARTEPGRRGLLRAGDQDALM
jgi:hypothetical protein